MLQTKIASAIAVGALMLNLASPAFAATITVSGNGDSSDSKADVKVEQSNSVVQNNDAHVNNDVQVNSNTGKNDANRNTGGSVSVDTGNSTANVTVANTLNSNSAKLDCCSSNGNTDLKISDNGVDSDNDIKVDQKNNQGIFQDNKAHVDNDVKVNSNTGKNDANRNTGGDVSVTTGNSDVTVNVSTAANANHAVIGGGNGNGGTLSAWIVGNGDSSDNDINVKLNSAQAIDQDNYADVDNKVDVDSNTGKNDANRNTGGDVSVDTGDATVDATVDNMLNFNHADLDCGCLLDDWDLKIGENGVDSDNDIKLDLKDDKDNGAFQDNKVNLDNKLKDIDASTGENDANRNTGDPSGDPSVETGNSDTTVGVSNNLNVNSVGDDSTWDFPGSDVHFSFDLGDLLDYLAAHS